MDIFFIDLVVYEICINKLNNNKNIRGTNRLHRYDTFYVKYMPDLMINITQSPQYQEATGHCIYHAHADSDYFSRLKI